MSGLFARSSGLSRRCQRTLARHETDPLTFDLRQFFLGRTIGAGVIIDISGAAELRFTVVMNGEWHGDDGVLKEEFTYGDSTKLMREWTIRFQDDSRHFVAHAIDVPGGAYGCQIGNSAVMNYRLTIPRKTSFVTVTMEDWMHLNDDGTLINRTRISKFGLTVGRLVAAFRPADDGG